MLKQLTQLTIRRSITSSTVNRIPTIHSIITTAASTNITYRPTITSCCNHSSNIRTFTTSSHLTQSASPAAPASVDAESHSDFSPKLKQRISTGVEDAKAQIAKDVATHEVFLYMKGTPAQPRCGFSANVVKILQAYPGVKFGSRDVLEDEYVREAIKQFSDWPTLPQLFVKGEFVGGSDIVGNMYKSGELDKLLGASPASAKKATA